MKPKSKFTGHIPDIPDDRDHRIPLVMCDFRTGTNLRRYCPPIYNQGELGCCVGFATTLLHSFVQIKELKANPFRPSELYVYYHARLKEGTVDQDAGCQIRDAVKSMAGYGVCPEYMHSYLDYQKKFKIHPDNTSLIEGSKHRINKYINLHQTEGEILTILGLGFPIACAIQLYDSFESDKVASNGLVSLPTASEGCVGGHAVNIVGNIPEKRLFIMRNHWDTDWGDQGYFYLPYDYILNPNLTSDFWCVTH